MVAFFRAVGLPTNLKGLGFSGDEQQSIRTIAERSIAEAPYLKQFVGEVTVETLSTALDKANRL
jgi:glycerol dehydrogenase